MADQLKQLVGIEEQYYLFGITMYNYTDDPIEIPMSNVESLVIEESLWSANVTGYIELQTWAEVIERGGKKSSQGFFIRNDGFARLKLSFKMCSHDKEDLAICKPKDHWERTYDLVLIHCEDSYSSDYSSVNDSFVKYRKYYFESENYHRLKMVNIDWNTSQGAKYGQPDEYHTMDASSAIASIIKTVGSSKQDPSKSDIKIGSSMWKGPDKPEYEFSKIDEDNWFKTDASLSRVRYINPVNSNALNAISYILSHAVDKYGYPVILQHGSTQKEQKAGWKLVTLHKLFTENKDRLAEKFFITDSVYPVKGDPEYDPSAYAETRSEGQNEKKPKEGEEILQFFYDTNSSHIKQYAYSPPGSTIVNSLTNRPLSVYDFQSHSLKIYQKYADVKNNYKYTEKEFVKLYSKGKLNICNNYINLTGNSALYSTTPRVFFPDSLSRNAYLWTYVTNSPKIVFEVQGASFRRPRLWFSVNRDSAFSRDNWLDYKLMGEWLCTRIVHVFNGNKYTNIVEGIKVDIWKNPPKTKPENETKKLGKE